MSASSRRARRIVVCGLAVVGLLALIVVRRPLLMAAPQCVAGRWHGCYEFRELSDTFDAMLDQLESHVEEERRFAANASHELRTPLAVSRTLPDVARKDPARDREEVLERLHVVNTRAIGLVEALLLLSRRDRAGFTRDSLDLSLLAEEAAETLLPLAEKHGITLDVRGGEAWTSGSAELLLHMVTNLVQNVLVHNLPADGTVTVRTGTDGDTSVLRVESTGHPVPPDLVPTITEPFRRGTDRVRGDGHAGVGLGLAIVRSVVRAHDGTLDLAARDAGGLAVTVRLPAARPDRAQDAASGSQRSGPKTS
ncbi:HAMP domain-containing sensor histidine kinase [Streptomyces sp. G1]|uniref:sensor histidine kinase n=1 Tax=Streptomyces sp. G1 TaxID=361572 RepID=UPI0020304859|nr:HAMP domain-containing sensor histidine kinase [Streptomyces sp. G1]MCM1976667.1 HAMP domain-containing histidine kinase [Streptomyces sp. G1]